MTDTATSPTAIHTRACRRCGTEMGHGYRYECPACGWRMGLIAISEVNDSEGNCFTQFIAEPPSRYARIGLVTAILTCMIIVGLGAQHSLGVVLLGLSALIVLAVVCTETRFGRVTYGLTPAMRVLAQVVIFVGAVLACCTIVGIILGTITVRPNRS